MAVNPVLIDGAWVVSSGTRTFRAVNPRTQAPLDGEFPVSPWTEIEAAVDAAGRAFHAARGLSGDVFSQFLSSYADRIEAVAGELVALAHSETALPVEPRLAKAELPRTVGQLRQAAAAARDGSWLRPIIDSAANIRSMFGPIGPVVVFGPNNFPFAFNSIAGGDFAAAVAAGCPVLAKGHSSHPATTRRFAVEAHAAAVEAQLPPGFIQLIYRTEHADGAKLVSHPLIAATGYTGGRDTGLVLKEAAEKAGNLFYAELSSINPVVILPGALAERGGAIADEFTQSCLMGAGQFCTNPGLVVLIAGEATEQFLGQVTEKFRSAAVGTLLGESTLRHLEKNVQALVSAGAKVLVGGECGGGTGFCYGNTLLRASGAQFLEKSTALQTEAFGNASLAVVVDSVDEAAAVLQALEGNLTGAFYTASSGSDDEAYNRLEPIVRQRVGRLLNDKMPTGVAVSAAMNHGGPFPATGHSGFTAVGMPTSIQRFAALYCYDGVRPHRLPAPLRDKNPTGSMWRLVNGAWTQGDVA